MNEQIGGSPVLELELHPSVRSCIEVCGSADLQQRTAQRLARFQSSIGLGGEPNVEIRTGAGDRAARVQVEGSEKPFPASFLTRLWFEVASEELRAMAFNPAQVMHGDGHGWLIETAERLAGSRSHEGARAMCSLVERLAREVLALHPGALLDAEQAARYFGNGQLDGVGAAAVLRFLLELGISLRDRAHINHLVCGALELGRSSAEASEEVFAALRRREIEVELDPRSFEAITRRGVKVDRIQSGDDRLHGTLVEAMTVVSEVWLRRLAAELPVAFVSTPSISPWGMRIQINDRVGALVPLPAPDEIGVSAPPRELARRGIPGRGLVDPLSGTHLTAVGEDRRDAVEAADLVPVLPQAYIVGVFARTLTALAYRLVAVDRVELLLARLESDYPILVHEAVARYSLAELTLLLRALVRERVAVDDPWRVLNALVIFDETERPDRSEPDRLDAALASVRRELGDRITLESCNLEEIGTDATAVVYETERFFEQRLERWPQADLPERELQAARRSVWDADVPAATLPVIVTSGSARPRLRRALDQELSDVSVLARAEIPTGVRLVQAGSVPR